MTSQHQTSEEFSPSPILVTGAHRSGTTWIGKMLAASPDVGYISEPLNLLHRPGVMKTPVDHWYTYICAQNETTFLPALQDTIAFRYHIWSEIQSIRSVKDLLRMGRDLNTFTHGKLRAQCPVLKDPFAVFSAPWFAERLGCRVVITVRHPAAVASSLKRLNWSFDFKHLLQQPLLMADWLEPHRDEMEEMQRHPDDVIGQSALLWCMIYQTIEQFERKIPQFIIVRHEDLSLAPVESFCELYRKLGLEFTTHVEEAVRESSSVKNPQELSKDDIYSVRLDSRKNIDNWKRRLNERQIERIYELTKGVASHYYSDEEWE